MSETVSASSSQSPVSINCTETSQIMQMLIASLLTEIALENTLTNQPLVKLTRGLGLNADVTMARAKIGL